MKEHAATKKMRLKMIEITKLRVLLVLQWLQLQRKTKSLSLEQDTVTAKLKQQ